MIKQLHYSIENVHKIYNLEKVCFGADAWSFANVKSEFENTFSCFFAYIEKDEILGYAAVRCTGDELQISNLAVVPSQRKKGLGFALLSFLIEFAKTRKCERLVLEVNTQNTAALKLYEKCNFEVVGLRKNYYRESRYSLRDAFTMVRVLETKSN